MWTSCADLHLTGSFIVSTCAIKSFCHATEGFKWHQRAALEHTASSGKQQAFWRQGSLPCPFGWSAIRGVLRALPYGALYPFLNKARAIFLVHCRCLRRWTTCDGYPTSSGASGSSSCMRPRCGTRRSPSYRRKSAEVGRVKFKAIPDRFLTLQTRVMSTDAQAFSSVLVDQDHANTGTQLRRHS